MSYHTTSNPNAARPSAPETPNGHDTLSGLLKQLRDETLTLFKQEVALVRTETVEKARQALRDAIKVPAGAVVALFGVGLLLLSLSILLAWAFAAAGLVPVAAYALSFAIVGILTLAAGLALTRHGAQRLANEDITPNHTIQSVRENADWLKEKTS